MKRKIAVTVGLAALWVAVIATAPPAGAFSLALAPGAIESAQAAVSKSLRQGGGGDVSAAGDRLGGLLSKWGPPVLIAIAGYFLIGALLSRNVGAGVGVVLVTLVALIFFVSPESIESLSKNIAQTVF